MNAAVDRSLRVLQVSFQMDELRREPEALLASWPTVASVAAAAAGAGLEVTVLQAGWEDVEFERDGVRYAFVRERPPNLIRRRAGPWAAPPRRRLERRAAAARADLVHVHGLAFPFHAGAIGRRLGLPVLVQDRADPLPRRWRRPLVRRGLAGIDAVAFTARALAEPWFEARLFPPDLTIHEVLGSSTVFSPGDRLAARAASGLHGDPCLLWAARLANDKDPFTLLDAVATAAETLPGLRLWCCYTEAPLLHHVQQRISTDPALAGRVHLLGAVPHRHVETLCRAADLFVSTSRREGTGFALLEALACGASPVVSDIPAFRRITAGRVGALVPPGDAGAFARAIVALAGREPQRARREARDHFERNLSFAALGAELRAAYETVVAAGRDRGRRNGDRRGDRQAPGRAVSPVRHGCFA